MSQRKIHRRAVFKRAAGAATALVAPSFVPASILGRSGRVPPSDKITVGFIGVGGHGRQRNLEQYLGQDDARVLAACDVDSNHLAIATNRINEVYRNKDCATYRDFRELLARDDIDAVMISTPDHWHVLMSVLAVRAGKDVQCEKPTLTIDEGKILVREVRKHRKVFQTSTEDRSIPVYHRIAELVRNGRIGKLQTIRVTLPQQPKEPGDPTPQPVPKDLDYDLWLGPAPFAPYTKGRVHFHFRWISDYSGGIIPDWGAHLFDTAAWASDTERSGPIKVEGSGTFWKGGLYDTAKDYHVEYTYAGGLKMILDHGGSRLRFEGTKGWVEIPRWRADIIASDPKILDSKIGPDGVRLYTNPAGEHRDFLDCVKSRKDPYFPADIGHRVSTLCHLADIALRLGRPLEWDPKAERFSKDDEANRMLSRPMREPWSFA